VLIMRRNEDSIIDGMRTQTDNPSPFVTQADNPGADLMRTGGVALPELPDPTIGGENGSRKRNGFNLGFVGRRARIAPFDGRMAKLPAITNPVQGEVGVSARATSQYVGVLNQLAQYNADSSALARSITGV